MKVGIIGAGQIAQVHGPLILKKRDATIVGIADKNIHAANSLASQLNVARVYEDAEAMIHEQKPDVVHVLVPPQYHAEVSVAAMERGVHVLVEKPMALSVADCRRMGEAARTHDVYLCVDHNSLFDHAFRRAMNMEAAGVIGELVSVEAQEVYDVGRNPAMSDGAASDASWFYQMRGGPLQDMLPHPAALVLAYLPEVTDVTYLGLSRGMFPGDLYDELKMVVKSDTRTGYISLSASERPDICSLTLRGTEGILYADSFNFTVSLRRPSALPRKVSRVLSSFHLGRQYLAQGIDNAARLLIGRIDRANGIETLIGAFYEGIRDGNGSPVPPEDALRAVELAGRVWPDPAEAFVGRAGSVRSLDGA